MVDAASESTSWQTARMIANELSKSGVDPFDVRAAEAARFTLVRRFVLDLLLIFAVVAIAAPVALMLMRAIAGEDPIDGREIWIASAALVLLLAIVAARSLLPARADAYEAAWALLLERVWPGAAKGDDFGTARLAFVRRASMAGDQPFPSVAPGRKP